MTRLHLVLPALAAASVLAVAGCGSSTTKASTAPTSSAGGVRSGTVQIAIKGFAYAPAAVTVKVGTTVVWTQDDATVHTVTDSAATGGFDSGTLSQGRTYTRTFTTPGTYDYICTIHPYMKATVTVVS